MPNLKRKLRTFLIPAVLLGSAVGATALPVPAAAVSSTYCGHGNVVDGLYNIRFYGEYSRPSSSYPFVEWVHINKIYRKGGQRGSEWILVGTETKVCH